MYQNLHLSQHFLGAQGVTLERQPFVNQGRVPLPNAIAQLLKLREGVHIGLYSPHEPAREETA